MLSPERQSARMSTITNDGLTLSGTGLLLHSCTHMATVGVEWLTSLPWALKHTQTSTRLQQHFTVHNIHETSGLHTAPIVNTMTVRRAIYCSNTHYTSSDDKRQSRRAEVWRQYTRLSTVHRRLVVVTVMRSFRTELNEQRSTYPPYTIHTGRGREFKHTCHCLWQATRTIALFVRLSVRLSLSLSLGTMLTMHSTIRRQTTQMINKLNWCLTCKQLLISTKYLRVCLFSLAPILSETPCRTMANFALRCVQTMCKTSAGFYV